MMAGVVGFEPTIPGPKPGALPLGHTPLIIIHIQYINEIIKLNLHCFIKFCYINSSESGCSSMVEQKLPKL